MKLSKIEQIRDNFSKELDRQIEEYKAECEQFRSIIGAVDRLRSQRKIQELEEIIRSTEARVKELDNIIERHEK